MLLVLVIALQVADIVTTYLILRSGGRELNPFMAKAMNKIGVIPALLVTKGALILALIAAYPIDGMVYVVAALGGFYVFIISNNVRVLRKLK